MTDALFERYKEALRRGHVASQRGRFDEALDAYGDAAKVAPDRALPLVGIGLVLTRLGKSTEALSAFDLALDRSPTDETALRGRIDMLLALGDRSRAAETLDRLVPVLESADRRADAIDAASRALDLAESRGRREALQAMVDRLAAEPDAPAAAGESLVRARDLLAGPIGPEPEAPPPPFDPAVAMAAVEDAAIAGDPVATRAAALAAARGHRAAGQLHAAIDACYQALATNPADPELHLALAELYADRGWRTTAADKLVLLSRLVEIGGDPSIRERVCSIATRLPDDPRLEAICA
jgi:tetratricopeptide (TPR) repeat protein